MEGLRTGAHPPRLPQGDPQGADKPVDWSTVDDPLALARQRANERMRAAGLGGD